MAVLRAWLRIHRGASTIAAFVGVGLVCAYFAETQITAPGLAHPPPTRLVLLGPAALSCALTLGLFSDRGRAERLGSRRLGGPRLLWMLSLVLLAALAGLMGAGTSLELQLVVRNSLLLTGLAALSALWLPRELAALPVATYAMLGLLNGIHYGRSGEVIAKAWAPFLEPVGTRGSWALSLASAGLGVLAFALRGAKA